MNRLRFLATFALAFTAGNTASVAYAQSAHFGGIATTSNLDYTSYGGVAVDSNGDLFVSDNTNRRILEYTASGKLVVLSTGGAQPEYLAVDKSNNLYAAVTAPAGVLKFPLSGGTYGSPIMVGYTSLVSPWGIAVDSNGNILVADHATDIVWKFAPAGSLYSQSVLRPAGVLKGPAQMAIDSKNNLYIADRNNNRIIVMSSTGSVTTPLPAVVAPTGIAIDSAGNVAVTGNAGLIYDQPTSRGSYSSTLLNSTFTTPYGVAFDSIGTLEVVDAGAQQIIHQTPPTAQPNFGIVGAGFNSAAMTYVFVFDTNQVLNGFQTATTATGFSGLSYNMPFIPDGGTCAAGMNFLVGQTCTANVYLFGWGVDTFTGIIQLLNGKNQVVGTAPAQGKSIYTGTPPPSTGGGCAVPVRSFGAGSESHPAAAPDVCF